MDQEISKYFLPYYSATYSRQYLTDLYERQNISQPESKSYHVCYSFMYHLQHGQLYLEQAMKSPLELKPVLLFYGLIQLIKSCILTVDPNYPENSQVLAHGVSARKRKKSGYQFLEDEVRSQVNGLFPHLLKKMFHMKHQGGTKYKMSTLLHHIADLHPLFLKLFKQKLSYQAHLVKNELILPSDALDSYHMTPNRFEQYLETFPSSGYECTQRIHENEKEFTIPLSNVPSSLFSSPWLIDKKGTFYLLKNRQTTDACPLPELAVHYLILYNLSMITRYEAEWWGELIHTFDGVDLPFILKYIEVAESKIPNIIATYLNQHTH